MKMKLILAAAAASALLLSSCRKADEVTPSESQFDELEFTATIEGPSTKTTVNTDGNDKTNRGKIEWVAGDEIKIKDAVGTEVTYVATSSGTTSTFRKKSGQSVRLGSGPYTATYGDAPSTTQNCADHHSEVANQAKNIYMTAESETRSLTFKAACGLLKLTLTAATGESDPTITKIEVSGTPDGKTDATTYTLNCVYGEGNGVSIKDGNDFYLTLPKGSYNEMKFYNTFLTCVRHPENGGMSISDNVIQPVTIGNISFPIEFTVSAGVDETAGTADDKKVKFTGGNLWCDTTKDPEEWHLESAQNVTYSTLGQSSYTASHVCHFYWSKDASVASANEYSDDARATGDTFFFGEGNELTVDNQGGLYALTKYEWSYLINSRTNASSLYKTGVSVTIGDKTANNCLVIAPDGYTGTIAASYDAAAWAKAEESGLVCLPAAGYRYGLGLSSGGSYGYYWSSTPDGDDEGYAYDLYFIGSNVYPASGAGRYCGHSVRLVCSVSK